MPTLRPRSQSKEAVAPAVLRTRHHTAAKKCASLLEPRRLSTRKVSAAKEACLQATIPADNGRKKIYSRLCRQATMIVDTPPKAIKAEKPCGIAEDKHQRVPCAMPAVRTASNGRAAPAEVVISSEDAETFAPLPNKAASKDITKATATKKLSADRQVVEKAGGLREGSHHRAKEPVHKASEQACVALQSVKVRPAEVKGEYMPTFNDWKIAEENPPVPQSHERGKNVGEGPVTIMDWDESKDGGDDGEDDQGSNGGPEESSGSSPSVPNSPSCSSPSSRWG